MKLLLCVTMMGLVAMTGSMEPVHKLNYGTIFMPVGQLDNSGQLWTHSYSFTLPTIDKVLPVGMTCDIGSNIDLCKNFPQLSDHVNRVKEEIFEEWRSFTEYLNHLLPPMPEDLSSMNRRDDSVLPFVGVVGKYTFGTGSTLDTDKIVQAVANYKNQVRHLGATLHANTRIMQSIQHISNQRFEDFQKEIKHIYSNLESRFTALNQEKEHAEELGMDASMYVVSQSQALWTARVLLNDLKTSVLSLANGRLPRYLVPPSQLYKSLEELKKQFQGGHSQLRLREESLSSYYHQPSVRAYVHNNNTIVIFLNFPVTSRHHALTFDVYKVTVVPSPYGKGTDHATKLVNVPPYFAVARGRAAYIEMDAYDPSECYSNICPKLWSEASAKTPACLWGIFTENKTMVKAECEFHFLPNGLKSFMLEFMPSNVLLSKPDTPLMACPIKTTLIGSCDLCVVQVPCRCSLSTGTSFITERLQNCHNTSDFSVLHTVNLGLLMKFYDEEFLKDLTGDKLLASKVDTGLPVPKISDLDISRYQELDRKMELSLDGTVEKIKRNEEVFQNDLHAFVSVDFSDVYRDNDLWSLILPGISASLGLVTIVLLLRIWLKGRPLSDKARALKMAEEREKRKEKVPMVTFTISPDELQNLEVTKLGMEMTKMMVESSEVVTEKDKMVERL